MIGRARARLTYANVAATVALFLALSGGVAYALGRNSVTTRELAKDAVKGRNVEDGKLKNKHLKDNTLKGGKIKSQTLGPVPTADSASAFARIRADGTVVDFVSEKVESGNVSRPADGVYCFNLPFIPDHVQATGVADGAADRIVSAEISGVSPSLPHCPPAAEVEVQVCSVGAGALENDSFFVQFGY